VTVVKPSETLRPFLADDIVSVQAVRLLLVSDHCHWNLLHFCTQRSRATLMRIPATPDQ